ncbi:lipopolysaccharide heptosyltransferase II [Sporomusaceae bacterium BoRhaA]|uniref:glycosyltransferase family 9 protein n=1 Tax=Pelorhabdus rhamnosifermentans TaxID=2772457 RepID=UPI001C064953|nr:glycosyltransferase family 9 protein [Pelorhabdus rhamnosifermentans]MBU2699023.1 lipopolysaccharide heptosyltransferase II [Pelorhabdus rhamnosifermentans]
MNNPKNILVYSLVNIGDVLLTTSAIALVRKAYPEARITAMVRPDSAPLMENNPIIDEVYIYKYRSKERSISSMLAEIKKIKNKHFDLCFAFDGKTRSCLLTFLAGIPIRIGGQKIFDDKFSWSTLTFTQTIPIDHDLAVTPQAYTFQAIVKGYTGQTEVEKPVIARITDANRKVARELLAALPKKKYSIALCVKGTFELKNWPKQYFAELVEKLSNRYDANFYIIGAPGDREYVDSVIQLCSVPIQNFCGKTGLIDLAALFEESDLLVTVDTGAMHIAATTPVPIVAMYGCYPPPRWKPLTDKVTTYHLGLPCCPCHIAEKDCLTKDCLTGISVDEVFKGACQWLDRNESL